MKIIFGVRGSGKTTALINESAETGYYIVARNPKEAIRILETAIGMKKDIPVPMTYNEVVNHLYDNRIDGFLIDELDNFLFYVCHGDDVKTITITPTVVTKLNLPKEYAEQAKILSSALPEEEKVKLLGGDWDVE